MAACQIYLITPPRLDPATFRDTLAAALDAGDVAAVQLRLKEIDDTALRHAIDLLRPVAQQRNVAFMLNDRPDLAMASGCDGAHVGQDDTPIAQARKILGNDLMLGATCHDSRDLAMRAGETGADYVAFGAFFPTTTKEPKTTATVDLLSWWTQTMELPCVAIGGITAENCAPLVQAGADFLAVSNGVWGHRNGPAQGVRDVLKAIATAEQTSAQASPDA